MYAVLNTTKHDVCALVNSTIYELNHPQVKPVRGQPCDRPRCELWYRAIVHTGPITPE